MVNTYIQLHIQFVFAVKYRTVVIAKEWRDELHKYTIGIIRENEHKKFQVNSICNHIHSFIGMGSAQSASLQMQKGKTERHIESIIGNLSFKRTFKYP